MRVEDLLDVLSVSSVQAGDQPEGGGVTNEIKVIKYRSYTWPKRLSQPGGRRGSRWRIRGADQIAWHWIPWKSLGRDHE